MIISNLKIEREKYRKSSRRKVPINLFYFLHTYCGPPELCRGVEIEHVSHHARHAETLLLPDHARVTCQPSRS